MIRGFDTAAAEEARRILNRFLPLKDSTTRTFDFPSKLGYTETSSYLLPVLSEKSLDYKYRETKLGRMSLPIMRLSEPDIANDQVKLVKQKLNDFPKKVLQGLKNRTAAILRVRAADLAKLPEGAVGNWQPEREIKLSAEIGQVLFPLDQTDPSKAMEAAQEQPSRSPFAPTFPGLSTLLASPDLTATARLKTPSLSYDFLAAPDQPNFEPGQLFPSLHIQMRTEGKTASMHKLTLGFRSRIHDILLPDKAADLRFFRSARLRYKPNHKDLNIREWTEAVTANIESGERLTAPPLRLEIPKWTIPGFPADAKGMRSVTYHFSGVQFRQSVSGDLLGENISLSTVQSGKLGGKGSALTAHYQGHGDTTLQDEVGITAFVERCFKMVDLVTEASSMTLPVSRQMRPRYEGGMRKTKKMGDGHGTNDRVVYYPAQNDTLDEDGEVESKAQASVPEEQRPEESQQPVIAEETALTEASITPEPENAPPSQETGDKFPTG
jgi:hypothetical protein